MFSTTQWVGAFGAVFLAAYATFALGNGASLRKLVAPTLSATLAAGLGVLSRKMLDRLTFRDYR